MRSEFHTHLRQLCVEPIPPLGDLSSIHTIQAITYDHPLSESPHSHLVLTGLLDSYVMSPHPLVCGGRIRSPDYVLVGKDD